MVGFFITLCKNINHFPIPNSDVFQYINDGQQYIKLKLPSSIHPPPFVPFLICFVAKIFKQVVQQQNNFFQRQNLFIDVLEGLSTWSNGDQKLSTIEIEKHKDKYNS